MMKGYIKYFRKAIVQHFPADADQLMREIETEFKALKKDILFSRSSKNPLDKRLGIAGLFLALTKVLDRCGENYDLIKTISLEIACDYVRPKSRLQRALKKLPAKLVGTGFFGVFLKYFNKKVAGRGHQDGFVAKIITDKEETFGLGYGVDILECGICKLFAKHDYAQYTSILCEVDHITSGMAGLKLVRTGTIANGAKKCDFRFKKEDS